jgi:hypothetical protein
MSFQRLLLIVFAIAIVLTLWSNRGGHSPGEMIATFKWAVRVLAVIIFLWQVMARSKVPEQRAPDRSAPTATPFEPVGVPGAWAFLLGALIVIVWLWASGLWEEMFGI